MFPSWLSSNKSKENKTTNSNLRHAVLGTALHAPLQSGQEEILFACGCFWGAEKGFWKLPGVITTSVGYAGGYVENPKYSEVCRGSTGHTEVVRVVWGTSAIDLSDLLKMFWECHDPTQGDRQGNDSGSQYRSAIYTTNDHQIDIVNSSKDTYQVALIDNGFGEITTEIKANQIFFPAETYHQQYLAKPGSRPYCSAMPTRTILKSFPGSNYKLNNDIWSHFNWETKHCVLRSNNTPIIPKNM